MFTVETQSDIKTFRVNESQLDASTAKAFKEDIFAQLGDVRCVIIDMSQVTFVDSSGCGAILSCLRKMSNQNGELCLCHVSKPVQTVFELIRMHRIVDIHDTHDDALAACRPVTDAV